MLRSHQFLSTEEVSVIFLEAFNYLATKEHRWGEKLSKCTVTGTEEVTRSTEDNTDGKEE